MRLDSSVVDEWCTILKSGPNSLKLHLDELEAA